MATLVLKNTTGVDVTIADASGIVIPASGQDTFTEDGLIRQLAESLDLRTFVNAGTIVVNDGTSDLSPADGRVYLADLWTQVGFDDPPSVAAYQMQLGGPLDAATLPLPNCGIEIVRESRRLLSMTARRATPGSSGTTTVQLEHNGSAVGGAVLSWTPADGAFALKAVGISILVAAGDRLSFRLTSAEGGAEDVFVEVD